MFNIFNKIPLIPYHWSGGESFIPAYEKQINFLKLLYPYVTGTKYLRHKKKIKDQIEWLEGKIEQEKVDVICRHLYM